MPIAIFQKKQSVTKRKWSFLSIRNQNENWNKVKNVNHLATSHFCAIWTYVFQSVHSLMPANIWIGVCVCVCVSARDHQVLIKN